MSREDVVKLKVGDDIFEVDMSDLEFDELGTVEDLCGRSIADVDFYSARGMQGLVWIAMHRRDPRFTIAEAGKLKFSAVKDMTDAADEEKPKRPTKAASAGKSGETS